MADFFISYTGADEAVASWVATQLEAQGYSTFFQPKDIGPADNFRARMREGLQKAKYLVAIFSSRYFDSDYCKEEYDGAHIAKKTVIPVLIETFKIPDLEKGIVYIDLTKVTSEKVKGEILRQGISRAISDPGVPALPNNPIEPVDPCQSLEEECHDSILQLEHRLCVVITDHSDNARRRRLTSLLESPELQRSCTTIEILLQDFTEDWRNTTLFINAIIGIIADRITLSPRDQEAITKKLCNKPLPALMRFEGCLEIVLKAQEGPLLISVHTFDRILKTPFRDEFCAKMRALTSKKMSPWDRLYFIVFTHEHPNNYIQNTDMSPFNTAKVFDFRNCSP